MDKNIKLITMLVKEGGLKLLFIDNRIYSVNSFTEATENNQKHHIIGRDITEIFKADINTNIMQHNFVNFFLEKVNKVAILQIFYHKDEKFVFYF